MNKPFLKAGGFLIFFVLVFLALWFFGYLQYLKPAVLQAGIEEFGVWAPTAFVVLYAVWTISFLPPTPLTLLGGALFGTAEGVLYSFIASVIAMPVCFLLSRYFLRDGLTLLVKKWFSRILKYEEKIEQNSFKFVFLARLVYVFPFAGVNYTFGLLRIKFRDYFWASFFGVLPGLVATAYLGRSLSTLDPVQIIIAATGFVAFFGLMFILNKKFFESSEV